MNFYPDSTAVMNYNMFTPETDMSGDNETGLAASQLMADISNADLMSILSARRYPAPASQDVMGHNMKDDCSLLQSLSFGFDVAPENLVDAYPGGSEGLNYLINGHEPQPSLQIDGRSTASSAGQSKRPKRMADSNEDDGPKEVSSHLKRRRSISLTTAPAEKKEANPGSPTGLPATQGVENIFSHKKNFSAGAGH
jgi:hypothetical protein